MKIENLEKIVSCSIKCIKEKKTKNERKKERLEER